MPTKVLLQVKKIHDEVASRVLFEWTIHDEVPYRLTYMQENEIKCSLDAPMCPLGYINVYII